MRALEQETIDDWIEISTETIKRRDKYLRTGWYQQRNLPLQVHYSGKAGDYATVARAQSLINNPIEEVRHGFREAATNILKCFSMAYNVNDHDYLGDKPKPEGQPSAGYGQVSWPRVNEIKCIEGINYALMANDFTTAEQLAYWYQDRGDGVKMDLDVNRYAFAYKYVLLDKKDEAQALLQETIDDCIQNKPTHPGDINYFTLSLTLQGIAMGSNKLFTEGLQQQLHFYEKTMTPADDGWDTEEEFFCDHAIALANLGLRHGLPVTVEHPLMPKRLLIDKS